MLDAIVLTLDRRDFGGLRPKRFSPSATGLLMSPYYCLGSRGNFGWAQYPTKDDLRAGRYRPRLTLNNRRTPNGFALTLRLAFSAPKFVLANNFDELASNDFKRILGVFHWRLDEMGMHPSSDVYAIHYSKNIALTDYTTCSMILSELALTKRLDLTHTTHLNEGHAIRGHANRFDIPSTTS